MPAIPLGLQSYQRKRGSQPETRLVNLYLEKDESGASPDATYRLSRPGLTSLVTFPAAIRGVFQSDGVLGGLTFVVAGDTLYSTDLASITAIGTLTNDGDQVVMAANFEWLGIVTANEFWAYNGTTLTKVALPDDKPVVDLDVINSYFLHGCADGTIYWLPPGDADYTVGEDALNFASAEAQPDGLVAIHRIKDDIYLFGTRTIEVWQSTGVADSLYQRAPGRLIDRGCQSRDSVRLFDNSIMFVGDDGIVYRVSDVPTRVSTFGIEERIRQRTDLCSAFVFTSEGHKFYVLRIPGQGSFAFDAATQVWSEFSTLGAIVWAPAMGLDTNGGAICADSTGKLYRLDPDAVTDDGLAVEKLITGTISVPAVPVRNSAFAAAVGQETDATYQLRWRDAHDSGWTLPVAMPARAGADIVNVWRLGATRGPFRTYELSTLSPTIVRISGAVANEAWAT